MRTWLLAILFLLAGCIGGPDTSPPDEETRTAPDPEAPTPATAPDPRPIVFDDLAWHSAQSGVGAAVDLATYAGQSVVPGCLDPMTGEPDGWNMPLAPRAPVINGTAGLRVLLEWDAEAYIRDELVLAYKPAGQEWTLSEYIQNGVETEIPVAPETWDEGETSWEYAVCLVREEHRNVDAGADWRPGAFRGDLHVEIEVATAAAA